MELQLNITQDHSVLDLTRHISLKGVLMFLTLEGTVEKTLLKP